MALCFLVREQLTSPHTLTLTRRERGPERVVGSGTKDYRGNCLRNSRGDNPTSCLNRLEK